jgi:hypothetical protein
MEAIEIEEIARGSARYGRTYGQEEQVRMQRSPAMAAGLTDHIWEIEEMLTRVVAHKAST